MWLLSIGFAIVLFIAAVMTFGYYLEKRSCNIAGNNLQVDTRFDFMAQGCYVRLADGRYIALEQYKAFETNEN